MFTHIICIIHICTCVYIYTHNMYVQCIYSRTSLIQTPLGQIKERGVLNSEVIKYTNVTFGTDESVLFREVSLIQECPYREVPLYVYIHDI